MDEVSEFVEHAALYFGGLGLSRTGGRIMGLLLTVDENGVDAPELCSALSVAKSSVSVELRRLEDGGLIERFRLPGHRRDRFRLADDVFGNAFRAQMSTFQAFTDLAGRGLRAVGDDPVKRRRLERMRDMYAFMAERFPALLDEWEQGA